MALYRMYFVVENRGMLADHFAALLSNLNTLGPLQGQANELMQNATSLNGQAVIYEASFDETKLSINEFTRYIAEATGGTIRANQITNTQSTISYSATGDTRRIDFSYSNALRVRVELFGGVPLPTWQESNNEVTGYLRTNADQWYDYSGGS